MSIPVRACSVRKLVAALAVIATLLSLSPVASTAGRQQRVVALVSRCHTSELGVSLSRGGVALGNVGVNINLRNRVGHSCSLFGYVEFALESSRHEHQPTHLRLGNTYFQTDPRPHRVMLRPGERAVTNLAWTDSPLPGERQTYPCEPSSSWLEVTPPGERAYRLVRFGSVVCGHGALASTALTAARKTTARHSRASRVTNRCPASPLPLRKVDLPALRRFALKIAPHGVQKEGSHPIDYRDATARAKFPTFYTGYVRSDCPASLAERVISRTADVSVGYPHVSWSASLSYSVFLIVRERHSFVSWAQMH